MLRAMDSIARSWLLAMAKKNYWRICKDGCYDLDDLIQDGFACYARVVAQYPNVTSRSHLMSLFKRTYQNHLHDLAKKQSRMSDAIAELPIFTDSVEDQAAINILILDAPPHLKTILILLSTEEGRRRLRAIYRVTSRGRETVNDRLCRLVQVDPLNHDLQSTARKYFSHG